MSNNSSPHKKAEHASNRGADLSDLARPSAKPRERQYKGKNNRSVVIK
jgi:hypothetical protein